MIAFFRKSAFWRLLIPFIFGVVLQNYFRLQIPVVFAWIVSGTLLCILGISVIIRSYFWRGLFGVTLTSLCLWIGVLLTSSMLEKSSWDIPGQTCRYSLLLLEDPVPRNKTLLCKARISGSNETLFDRVVGKQIVVYLPKDERAMELIAGDGIVIETVLKKPESPRQTGFNYASYLEKQGFSAVGYVGKEKWQLHPTSAPWGDRIKFLALACRRKMIEQLKNIVPNDKNAIVAAALFVGSKDGLDPELRDAFSSTGLAHILAVSGLHLTTLFAILCFLLSPMEQSGSLRSVSRAIIMLLLWTFTFVTGLSPSIVRACIMTCFVGMGVVLNRRSTTMNTLAASALFMLIYNPLYLFDVGFQLSYAAVISIVLINPYVVRLRLKAFKSRISGYFWELSCVSVSAQCGTVPLTLYYFHQFPLLFIPANLFAIPLSGLLLVLIPFSILLQTIYSLPAFMFMPLNVALDFFVSGIEMFSFIPFSVLTASIDAWDVLIMYVVIGGLLLKASKREKRIINL